MLGQVPDAAAGSEFADESESVWDGAGAHRVTEMSDTIRVDSSILSINRCRMAGRTWRGAMALRGGSDLRGLTALVQN